MDVRGLTSFILLSLSPGGSRDGEDKEGEVGGVEEGEVCVVGLGGRLEEGKGLSSNPSGTSTSSWRKLTGDGGRMCLRAMVCVATLRDSSPPATVRAQVCVTHPSAARSPMRSNRAHTASLPQRKIKGQ